MSKGMERVTPEAVAALGKPHGFGNVPGCEMHDCNSPVDDYAIIGQEAWFFCRLHFNRFLVAMRNIKDEVK